MKWQLQTMLNGTYSRTVWNSQEGAIADRERQLRPRRIRKGGEWRTIWPLGWTAITRLKER